MLKDLSLYLWYLFRVAYSIQKCIYQLIPRADIGLFTPGLDNPEYQKTLGKK